MNVNSKRFLVILAIFATIPVVFPSAAYASTIYSNATSGNDTTGDGTVSKPYKTFHKAYMAAVSGDTLQLSGVFSWSDASETGDTTLGYALQKSLSIRGDGASSTIIQAAPVSGVADRRIFWISGDGISTNLSNLTLRNGVSSSQGGAIDISSYYDLKMSISGCVLENNSATGNGGAIANIDTSRGSITIENSVFRNNSASSTGQAQGGAIYGYFNSIDKIASVTFESNHAKTNGSAISFESSARNAFLSNVTIAYNHGGGAALAYSSYNNALILLNSTIAYNTASSTSRAGGFDVVDTDEYVIMKNSLIAKNFNDAGALDFQNSSSAYLNVNNSIIEVQAGSSRVPATKGNILGPQTALNLDVALSQNNSTRAATTLALLPGSIAINSGAQDTSTFYGSTASAPQADARGLFRNGAPDIGAFEYDALTSLAAPLVQAADIKTTGVTPQGVNLSWTNGDGINRIVFVKQGADGLSMPSDSATYTASTTLDGGTQIGTSGWHAAYKGPGTTAAVAGLTPGTDYRAHVVEYNGDDGDERYLLGGAIGNPVDFKTLSCAAPTLNAQDIIVPDIIQGRTTVTWTRGDGSSRVLFVKESTSTDTVLPQNGVSYVPNLYFKQGAQVGSTGWYATYAGSDSTATVFGLDSRKSYVFQVVEQNCVGTYAQYLLTATATNPVLKQSHVPVTIYVNALTGDDVTGDGTVSKPYHTFTKAYQFVVDGDAVDAFGAFTWTDSDETGVGSNGFELRKSISIIGHGATSTIFQAASSAGSASRRVFSVAVSLPVSLSGMTVRHGNTSSSGGCLYTQSAELTLDGVTLTNCRSGYDGGAMYVNSGVIKITGSAFEDNRITSPTSGSGGAMAVYSDSLLVESTSFKGNEATVSGGAVYTASKSAQFINTTFYGNIADAAVAGSAVYICNATNFTNVTMVGNIGTGVINTSCSPGTGEYPVSFKNTLVANNATTLGAPTGIMKSSGASLFVSEGYNIVDQYQSNIFTPTTGDWTNQDGDGDYSLFGGGSGQLLLGTLTTADNGTAYLPLLQTSIGVDQGSLVAHGTVAIPLQDQRGLGRDALIDIGAFEYALGADTTLPSVALVAPLSGTFDSMVNFVATAADDRGIAHVSFLVDGVIVGVATSSPYIYSWDVAAVAAGTKILAAVAVDTSGNSATSSSASIIIFHPDVTPPIVAMSSPSHGAIAESTILISATATDDYILSRVDFYSDNMFIGMATATPYTYLWDVTALPAGERTIVAVAHDASGNTATSSSRIIRIAHRIDKKVLSSRVIGSSIAPAVIPVAPAYQQTTSSGSFKRNLSIGMRGKDIISLQTYLNQRGFVVAQKGAGAPGSESIYFGPATRRALARFQTTHGIFPATGNFGPLTRAFISRTL